jgi:hydrogenase maturation protease
VYVFLSGMTGCHHKPVLVLGWGNRSRGDDALGPLCVAALQSALPAPLQAQVDFLEDYQLQVEYALDLVERQAVLFIDASLTATAPFEVHALQARRDTSYSSHAVSAQSLLQVFEDLYAGKAPAATLLAIRGESFELGDPLGAKAQAHLTAALDWALSWLSSNLIAETCHA